MITGSFLAKCSTIELSTADEKHYTLKNNPFTRLAFRTIGIPHVAFRTRANFILREINTLSKNSRILDAGCGYGIYSLTLAERGYTNIDSIDLEERRVQGVEKTLTELPHTKSRVRTHHGSLTNLPFADRTYKAIICSEVIEHIAEHEKATAELARVLEPSGNLVLSVPYYSKNNTRIYKMFGHERPGYTKQDLEKLFHEHKLAVTKEFYFEYALGNVVFKFFNYFTSKPLMGILFYPCYALYTIDRYLKIGEPNCIAVVLQKTTLH